MSHTPFELAGGLQIGTVDFVSPDEIRVILIGEAPESIALNAGVPRPFPRVNDYLLIPVDENFLIGQVQWITVERYVASGRRDRHDSGLVDLPYPHRKLLLNPVGTLQFRTLDKQFVFQRGADALPSLGAAVMLPTQDQLRAVVENVYEQRHIKIGSSPLAGNAEVRIDPNRLFGRHLAVLGNTGSGKSCSVAGLVRWSLEQAQLKSTSGRVNARFIVLDPNGEYARAFQRSDSGVRARIFRVNAAEGEFPLRVPLWFWNSEEWCSFVQASPGTQRPLLLRALREIKAGRIVNAASDAEERKLELRRYISFKLVYLQGALRSGTIGERPTPLGFFLKAMNEDLKEKSEEFYTYHLLEIRETICKALRECDGSYLDRRTGETVEIYRSFPEHLIRPIIATLQESADSLGGIIYQEGPGEDVPLPFSGLALADHLDMLAKQENVSQYLDFLVARIRTLLSNPRLSKVIDDERCTELEQWLKDYIGNDNVEDSRIRIIDLSLVPSESVHVITAVIARMIFESHQRYLKRNHVALPTVLVMEEAHTFIRQYRENIEYKDAAVVCCQAFERIAREGRKFGLGLVLSSQRPSELSRTVLSQCNTFLLHRLSNDHDQDIVHRLVPDNLKGLLRDLPSLPSQSAILLGWAADLPVFVRMNDLPKEQQPRSADPELWKVWIGKEPRPTDWDAIVGDWQGDTPNNENVVAGEYTEGDENPDS